MAHGETWSPWEYIFGVSNRQYAVVVLNRPINVSYSPNAVLNMWNKASVRVLVDGGADRWLSWTKLHNYDSKQVKTPDLITGDMDSMQEQTFHYYLNVNPAPLIQLTPDQNETDYTKSLRELNNYTTKSKINIEAILVLVDTSGRIDQIMGNVNTLFKVNRILENVQVIQIASDSVSWLLTEGNHLIEVPKCLRENKEWCAVMPIGARSVVTTSGLKWNLFDGILEFGGMVSTSNTYNGESTVTIKTTCPVLWAMGIDSLEQT